MKQENYTKGKIGESLAENFLKKQKYKILQRNHKNKIGEIDIIAENDEYIVFVEVKTRRLGAMVTGTQSIDRYKINRIRNLANDFLSKFSSVKPPRFDVADVIYDDTNNKFSVNYIESAF